jgi:hypothetical protein
MRIIKQGIYWHVVIGDTEGVRCVDLESAFGLLEEV